jgi:hypothetical protein
VAGLLVWQAETKTHKKKVAINMLLFTARSEAQENNRW